MRVLTMNLWGRRGEWGRRRQVLLAGLRTIDPDLVAFQEAINTDEYDQVRDLLGADFHIVHSTRREPGGPGDVEPGQGISIASRWRLGESWELDLPQLPQTAAPVRTTLMVEVGVRDQIGPLLFINHNPSWQVNAEYERQVQAMTVARAVEDMVTAHPRHVVLAGDLNADLEAASIRFWTGRQAVGEMSVCYRDAWESRHPGEPGLTFTPDNPLVADWDWPFQRIDHILVRCGEHGGPTLQIHDCSLAFNAPVDGVWASDHFGLVAELDIPQR